MAALCLSHLCTLEVSNLSGFTGSDNGEKFLSQDESYLKVHLYLIYVIFR